MFIDFCNKKVTKTAGQCIKEDRQLLKNKSIESHALNSDNEQEYDVNNK